jgi:hypothetical protein
VNGSWQEKIGQEKKSAASALQRLLVIFTKNMAGGKIEFFLPPFFLPACLQIQNHYRL